MGKQWPVLLFSVFAGFNQAAGSMGFMPEFERPKDRYQCSPVQRGVQNIDLLINGSNERFQGIARLQDGKVVEVSGVVSSYAMQAPGVPLITPAEESKLWARWRVFNVVLSKFMIEKFKKENPNLPQYVQGDEDDEKPANGMRMVAPGEYPGSAGGDPGGGMMGGFGFVGAYGGAGAPASNSNSQGFGSGFGSGFGGGVFSMGMGTQLSAEDYAEVDRRVDEYIERKEKRREQRREERQARKDALKPFQPPPPPPAATAAPRRGDNLPERPGDVIARQMRPGDLIAQQPRPGDLAAAQARPGDIAAEKTPPNDIQLMLARTPIPLRPGDLVEERRGAVIGRDGVYNFTAVLNPQTGKVHYAHRTNAQNFTQLVVQNGQARSGDAQLSVINQFVARAQGYGECCKQDSKAKCDIKFDPKSQEALARFKEVTKNPDAVLGEQPASTDEGGAMFNPFTGSRPRPGVYSPAKGSGTQK